MAFARALLTVVGLLAVAAWRVDAQGNSTGGNSSTVLNMTGPGNWTRPEIEGLKSSVPYQTNRTFYAHLIGTSWQNFTVVSSIGQHNFTTTATPVAEILRNSDAQGWDFLSVRSLVGIDAYYVAGYAEGFVTYKNIYNAWYNTVEEKQRIVLRPQAPNATSKANETCISDYVNTQIAFLRNHEKTTPFGRQLANLWRQMEGMADGWRAGYEAAGKPRSIHTELNFTSIYLLNYLPEFTSVKHKCTMPNHTAVEPRATPQNLGDHCSVLYKVSGNDVIFGHTTWFTYESMTRSYKTYHFPGGEIASIRVSSYPGVVGSTDDWFLTGAGLAVTETTLGNMNETSSKMIRPESTPLFMRSVIASYLATTPAEWVALFKRENSGQCNNQWQVLQTHWAYSDLNASRPMRNGTFWVAEQSLQEVIAADQTALLAKQKYWASYNVPFYPQIVKNLNFTLPDVRGRMFERQQGNVTNVTGMYYMLRYNNYEHDKISTQPECRTPWTPNGTIQCPPDYQQNPNFAIAARGDLQGPDGFALYGATDVKVSTARVSATGKYKTIAQVGPTTIQQKPFVLSHYVAANPEAATVKWRGLPNTVEWDPVELDDTHLIIPETGAPTPTGAPAATTAAPTPAPAAGGNGPAPWVVGLLIIVALLSAAAAGIVCVRSSRETAQHKQPTRNEDTPLVDRSAV
uniref:Phospholipase B-like n=1 Tax=Neobodo designis TaxID=312471 RepID=A0A7S1LTH2_NEODS|mmetsp:Transcript_28077/g.86981  ORF Transcript_28077/g.86981 Transcript_28077/m.86981 type:complete len:685 (+) Transcript_28077:44-2098(+)|eukprot:CAMPEP_0174847386 /NCGR_PEP_ID=MMETSP1114-20130205/12875_1 /TAXON_ID=312471 /ORGANISM="Neobodo designis, Strain CCAP 1951/1" /LENGTH=684 /DNA_ID=CAMNT_0016081663 /DNA_START=23 /DNA_END=2077 /DNA_ORIENTATION=+